METVDVIIPAYRPGKEFEKLLDSLSTQKIVFLLLYMSFITFLLPEFLIRRAVPESFQKMRLPDCLFPCQICDGPRHFDHPMITSRA